MKKNLLPIAIVVFIIFGIAFKLYNNKKIIDKSNEIIDRTKIPVAVSIFKVKKSDLVINYQYPAQLKSFAEANLTSQISGVISDLNLELGQQVKKGQVIGKLNTQVLQINLKTAEINCTKMYDDYNRSKDLYQNKAGLEVNMIDAKNNYDNALNQVKLLKQQISDANIIAPLSGTITSKNVKFGEFINPGTPIATITNTSSMKATAYVDQNTIYKLKLGQQAIITSSAFNQIELIGEIIFINSKSDANHNYQVDLLLQSNKNISLKSGTDVNIMFKAASINKTLQIPKIAIIEDKQEPFVYVIENNIAKERTIKIGINQNNFVEVISGLQDGETIITNGQINLKEGSIVNIVK